MENFGWITPCTKAHTMQFNREEDNKTSSQLIISSPPDGDKACLNQLDMQSFPDMDAVMDMPEDKDAVIETIKNIINPTRRSNRVRKPMQ
eukprot:15116984-Ditylum_brightwellii.AAC.1